MRRKLVYKTSAQTPMGRRHRHKAKPPGIEPAWQEDHPYPGKTGDRVTLEITDVAFGGEGVGRHEGFVVFVPFVITGEVVEAEIIEIHRQFARAALIQVIQTSPLRTDPVCPKYTQCGGCQYQHIAYEHQLQIKHKQVKDLFERIGGQPSSVVERVVACPSPYGYRNRIMVRTQYNRDTKAMNVGYLRHQSRLVVDVDSCPIAEPALNEKLQQVRVDPPRKNGIKFTLRVFPEGWELPPDSFFQVNYHQLPNMVAAVEQQLRSAKVKHLIDAYCGVGFFSLSLAHTVDRFTGVEVDKRAIESARLNAKHMGHQNGHFIEGTTEDHIQALVDQHDAANTAIILDPPRKGCHQSILEVLIQAKPRQIIYVSCQPATLSRDIKTLCDSGVFEVHKVIPLDMFPQTQHVECVTDIRLRQKE